MKPLLTSLLALGLALPAMANHQDRGDLLRLLVADAEAPVLGVHDWQFGSDPTLVDRLDLIAAGRVHLAPSGATAVVHERHGDRISLIDTGLILEDHGDHAHAWLGPVSVLPLTLEGAEPVHFNRGAGLVASFFDGSGEFAVWREADLRAGNDAPVLRQETGAAHHGLAMPGPAGVFVGVPADGERLPQAIALLDMGGAELARLDCPGAHGAGISGPVAAFGCTDGVALIDSSATPPAVRHMAYPTELGEGAVRNLRGAITYRAFLGDFGPQAMVLIDPAEADGGFTRIDLPASRMAFTTNPAGDTGFALLEDGRLVRLNTMLGTITAELHGVTAGYSMERGVIRPMLALDGDWLAVSDPARGSVAVVDLAHWEVAKRIETGGIPQSIALILAEGYIGN